ncbi:hypothetical protein ACJDU8_17210 [Clostridium sp. WILCCON 0269]|uniref:Uncharacterized protein n=1 Tax=Candidatus Clostridium eludens TaxID=3381663 RepID=A0ABW8SNS7_9CLOT
MADLTVKVDIAKADTFKGFIDILKGVMQDKRVPDEVKCDIKNKVNDLVQKNRGENNAKIK